MFKAMSRSSLTDKPRNGSPNGRENATNSTPMDLNEWRRAISTPTKYRVGTASINLRPKDIMQIIVLAIVILCVVFMTYKGVRLTNRPLNEIQPSIFAAETPYNDVYPLSSPIRSQDGTLYRIAIISDLDQDSAASSETKTWYSVFMKGYLTRLNNGSYIVVWDKDPVHLINSLAQGGRGMELSELVVFNGKLLTVDDRTGVVYRVHHDQVIPWLILADGNGDVSKGFKAEWATVKDGNLYIGGLGKEWTSASGQVVNLNPQYIKRVSPQGAVEHIDWHTKYNAMRDAAGFLPPGYLMHESAVWSRVHRRWYFLPRRASKERYDDKLDEHRAANIMISCDETFESIDVKPFGLPSQTHGFSSFKFIPDTNDEHIIALKSEEIAGKTATYIVIYDISGNELMKETFIGPYKYEGLEFI